MIPSLEDMKRPKLAQPYNTKRSFAASIFLAIIPVTFY